MDRLLCEVNPVTTGNQRQEKYLELMRNRFACIQRAMMSFVFYSKSFGLPGYIDIGSKRIIMRHILLQGSSQLSYFSIFIFMLLLIYILLPFHVLIPIVQKDFLNACPPVVPCSLSHVKMFCIAFDRNYLTSNIQTPEIIGNRPMSASN